jgi:hypothetical protein
MDSACRFPLPGSSAVLYGHSQQSAAAAASVEDLSRATIHDLGLQSDLPQLQPTSHVPLHFSLHLPDALAWLVVGVALAVLLYCLKDVRWRRAADAGEPTPPPVGSAAAAADHLANAEDEARAGRFARAMHEVLLEGVRLVRARTGGRVADSLTSREILRQAPLPEPGRTALQAIVAGVEWTHFGARPATLADYRACRESLDALRSALRGAAAA